MFRMIVVIVTLGLVFAASAHARPLSRAAAGGEARVSCWSQDDIAALGLGQAWGFFHAPGNPPQPEIVLTQDVCRRINGHKTNVATVQAWHVLAHESSHWYCWSTGKCDTTDESLVDCIGYSRAERIMVRAGLKPRYVARLSKLANEYYRDIVSVMCPQYATSIPT